MNRYPPHTDDIQKLAEFFDSADTAELAELENAPGVPERDSWLRRRSGLRVALNSLASFGYRAYRKWR